MPGQRVGLVFEHETSDDKAVVALWPKGGGKRRRAVLLERDEVRAAVDRRRALLAVDARRVVARARRQIDAPAVLTVGSTMMTSA